jgi:hypothetical protein
MFLAVPAEVLEFLRAVKRATNALQKWDGKAPHVAAGDRKPKHFTPDGRMVGDIGEVLAERFFCLRLEKDQKAGYDGILETDNKTKVEIKITRKKAFQFRKITDRVIALSLTEGAEEVEVVFNGPGKLLVEKAPGMKRLAKRKGDHWHFEKPFNIAPHKLRGLVPHDDSERVPLRAGTPSLSKP